MWSLLAQYTLTSKRYIHTTRLAGTPAFFQDEDLPVGMVKAGLDATIEFFKRAGLDNSALEVVNSMPDAELDKLLCFRDTAKRLVATYVTLIPEQSTEAKMTAALLDTQVAKLRGSQDPIHPPTHPIAHAQTTCRSPQSLRTT